MRGLEDFLRTRQSYAVINPNNFEYEKNISTLCSSSFKRIIKFLNVDLVSALYYLNLVIIQVSEVSSKKREKKRKRAKRKQSERSSTSMMSLDINPVYGKIACVKKSYTIIYPNKYSSQDEIISKSNELKDSSLRRILRFMGIKWQEAFSFISITVVNYLYEELKRKAISKKKKQKKKTKKIIQEVDIDPSFKRLLEFLKIYNILCASDPENDGLYVPQVSVQRIIRMMGLHWYYIVEFLQVNITIFNELQSHQRTLVTNLNRKAAYEYNVERIAKFNEVRPAGKWNRSDNLQIYSIFDMIDLDPLFKSTNMTRKDSDKIILFNKDVIEIEKEVEEEVEDNEYNQEFISEKIIISIPDPNKTDMDRFHILADIVKEGSEKATDEPIEKESKIVVTIEEVEPQIQSKIVDLIEIEPESFEPIEAITMSIAEEAEVEKPEMTPFVFLIKKKINYGDAIYLTGSCAELYEWDINQAMRLEWYSGDIWIANINLNSKSFPFKYRYFISNYSKIVYPVEWIDTIDVSTKHLEMLKKFDNDSIKVMSCNLRYENQVDGVNIWNNRKVLVSRMIGNVSSDIIGIQEGKLNQINYIKNNFLPIYFYEGISRSNDPNDEQNGIFYNNQKYVAVNSGHFWLSDTPWIQGSITYGNLFPRLATWVQLRKIVDVLNFDNNINYIVFNTHFDHGNHQSRLPCAIALIQEINIILQSIRSVNPKAEYIVILTGSFYSQDDDPAVTYIINNGFISTSIQMENNNKTFHNFCGLGLSKWDHIFYKTVGNLTGNLVNLTKSYDIIKDSEEKEDKTVYLSDHFPICAVISDNI